MTIRKEIDIKKPLTDEQKQILDDLKDNRPITADDDIPELTDEQIKCLRPRKNPYAARLKTQEAAKYKP